MKKELRFALVLDPGPHELTHSHVCQDDNHLASPPILLGWKLNPSSICILIGFWCILAVSKGARGPPESMPACCTFLLYQHLHWLSVFQLTSSHVYYCQGLTTRTSPSCKLIVICRSCVTSNFKSIFTSLKLRRSSWKKSHVAMDISSQAWGGWSPLTRSVLKCKGGCDPIFVVASVCVKSSCRIE